MFYMPNMLQLGYTTRHQRTAVSAVLCCRSNSVDSDRRYGAEMPKCPSRMTENCFDAERSWVTQKCMSVSLFNSRRDQSDRSDFALIKICDETGRSAIC